jgi:ferredoxin
MGAEVYFLQDSDLTRFISLLRKGTVYGTVDREGRSAYEKVSDETEERILLAVAPPVESLKSFLFPAKERVAVYPSSLKEETPSGGMPEESSQTVIGARACDICAMKVLDKIFLEQDVKDPFYESRRKNMVLVTTDCVEAKESCFCNLLGEKPYPEQGYDVNFSPIEGGYLVSSGSEKGQEIVARGKDMLKEASAEQLADRDKRREAVSAELKKQNAEFESKVDAREMPLDQLAAEKWAKLTGTCVECGACNFICPTCHCFLLYDQPCRESSGNERQKTWDSCLLGNYAKMAGVGGMKPTPRPELRDRFENRIRHKFEWMVGNINLLGCVGCGRCIEACMAGLDIRDTFKEFGQ